MEHLFTVRTVHHTADTDDDNSFVVEDDSLDWNVAGSAAIIQAVGLPQAVASDGSRALTVLLCNMGAAGGAFEKLVYTLDPKYLTKSVSRAVFGLNGRVLIASGGSHLSFLSISGMLAGTPHQAELEQPANMMRGFSDRRLQSPAQSTTPAVDSSASHRASSGSDAGLFGWLLGSSATDAPARRSSTASLPLPSSVSRDTVRAGVQVSLGRVGSDDTDIDSFTSSLSVPVAHMPLPETVYAPLRSQWTPSDASSGSRLGAVTCTVWWSPWLTGVHTMLAGHSSGHVTLWDVSAVYKHIGGTSPPDGAATVKQLMQQGVADAPAELQAAAQQRVPHPSGLLWWFHSPSEGAVLDLQVADCRTDVMLGEAIGVASASGSPVTGSSQLLVTMTDGRWQAALQCVTLTPLSQPTGAGDSSHLPASQRDVDAPWSTTQTGGVSLPGLGSFSVKQQCIFSHDWSDACAVKRSVYEADGLVSLRPLRFCSSQQAALSYARADPGTQEHRVVFAAPPVSASGSCWAQSSTLHGSLLSTAVFRPATRRLLVYRPDHDDNEQLAMFLQLPPPEVMMQGIQPRGARFDMDADAALPLHLRIAPLAALSPLGGGRVLPAQTASPAADSAEEQPKWDWEARDFGRFVLPHERFVWVAWTADAVDPEGHKATQSFVAVLSVAAVATRSTNTGLTPSDARGVAVMQRSRRPSLATERRASGGGTALPSSVGGALLQNRTRQRAGTMEMVLGQQAVAIPVLEKAYAGSAALAVFSLPPGEAISGIAFGRAYLEDRAAQMDKLRSGLVTGRNAQAADCIPSAVVTTASGVYEVAPVTITSASHFLASTAAVPSLGHALATTLGLPQAQVSTFTAIAAAAELKRRQRAGERHEGVQGGGSLSDASDAQLAVAAFESACAARTPPSETLTMLLDTGFEYEACVYASLCMGFELPAAVRSAAHSLPPVRAMLFKLASGDSSDDDSETATHIRVWRAASSSLIKVVSPAARQRLAARVLQLAAVGELSSAAEFLAQPAEQMLAGQWFHPLHLVQICPDVDVSSASVGFAISGRLLVALQLALLADAPLAMSSPTTSTSSELRVDDLLSLLRAASGRSHSAEAGQSPPQTAPARGNSALRLTNTAAVVTAALAAGHVYAFMNDLCLGWLALIGAGGGLLMSSPGDGASTKSSDTRRGPHGSSLWESVIEACVEDVDTLSEGALPQEAAPPGPWDALNTAVGGELLGCMPVHSLVQLLCVSHPSCLLAHTGRLRSELLQLLQGAPSAAPVWVARLAACLSSDCLPRVANASSMAQYYWDEGTWHDAECAFAASTAFPPGALHRMAALERAGQAVLSGTLQPESNSSRYAFAFGHEGLMHVSSPHAQPQLGELGLLACLARDWAAPPHHHSAAVLGAVDSLAAAYSPQALLDCFVQLQQLQAAAQTARILQDHVQACRLELAVLAGAGSEAQAIECLEVAAKECALSQNAQECAACVLLACAAVAQAEGGVTAACKWVKEQVQAHSGCEWTVVGLASALLIARSGTEAATVSSARQAVGSGVGTADQVSTAAATAGLSKACLQRAREVLLQLEPETQDALLRHPQVTLRTAQVLGLAVEEGWARQEREAAEQGTDPLVELLRARAF